MFKYIKVFFKRPTIKGNIRANHEKVYHVPGGQNYDSVIAEDMFYTEKGAQRAGYRKAKR